MPLDNYFTKPDYSRQLKQYSGTSATFSGATNILEKFSIKSIEVDTEGAVLGDALLYDAGNNKFRPGFPGSFSGSVISNGFLLSYVSGLTYNVGAGSYNVNGTTYPYLGENFNIISGQSGGSRFDLVYITAASLNVFIRTGITTTNPSLPNLQVGELEVGYIFVPANFTGGTGSTTIQTTGDSVFIYYNNGAGTGIQRAAGGANAAGSGDFSFATGVNSRAYGYNSNAFGYDTKASGYAQTVVGKFNVATDTDLFVVGAGTADSGRTNAFNVTNSGDTYANRKLFVTNVEIETTGATNGKVLKFNGTKFTPQLETITGATSFTGGTSIFSSITNNTLLFKSITGGSNVFLTESSGTIYVNVELSGASISGLTEIQSLTGGVSIISGKTGSTYFLYPLLGSGGTSVTLSNGKLLIYSDTSASTTGANVGPIAAAGVFYTKAIAINQLQFRRLSSATPSYLSIAESNELVLFNSTPPITGSTNATGGTVGVLASVSNKNIVGRTLSGTNRISLTQSNDVIVINSPIEVETGNAGTLSIYRTSSPIVYSSYTAASISAITVKLATHTIPITSRTYTIPDVKKDANFVMTEGNQTINGKKDFVTGFTVGQNGNTTLDFTSYDYSTPSNAPNSYYFYAPKDTLYSLLIDYTTSALTSQEISGNVSYTGTTFSGIDITTYTASTGTSYNSPISWELYNTCSYDAINYYYLGDSFNIVVSGYDQTLQTSLISYTSYTYTANTTIVNSTGNVLFNRRSVLENNILAKSFLIEGVSPITLPTSSFTSNSGITILKTTNIGPPSITQPVAYSGSVIGNYTKIGFNGNSNNDGIPFNYLTGTFVGEAKQHALGSFGGSNQKLISTYLENYAASAYVPSAYDTIKTLAFGFRSNVIAGVGSKSIFDIYIYKPLRGPGYNGTTATNGAAIYIEGKEIPHANSREPDLYNRPTDTSILGITYTNAPWSLFAEGDRAYIGNTLALYSGLTLSSTTRGAWLDIGNSTTTRPQINFASGGTAPTTPRIGDLWFDGNALRFRLSSSTVNLTSGGTGTGSFTGITDIQSAGTGNFSVISSVTNNKLVYRTISAGTGMNITESNGTLLFVSTATGGTSSTGSTSGTSLGDGVKVLFSSNTTSLSFSTLSSATPSTLSIFSSSTGVILFSAITSSASTTSTGITSGTSLGDGVKVLFSSNTTTLSFATLSSQTPSTLSIISSSTGVILFSAITSSASTTSTGITSGTSLGDGVKVLFSSDTTNLAFATLSSQTPSTLRIISSSTGVILFSATTGSGGGISGTYVSGITSAGTGNIQILSSITNNVLIYKTISAGTGVAISESNGTIIFSRSNTYFTTGITSASKIVQLGPNYRYDNIILTSLTSTDTVTAFTADASIGSYLPTPSIRFFAQTGLTVIFQNSNIIKTEGGLDAVIVGDNYDSITFEYNTETTKFYQTNINNYI